MNRRVRILDRDEYQEGEDVVFKSYRTADEAVRDLMRRLED